jgi:hypothetical protein
MRAIALSGYGTEEDQRRSRDAGFAEHLTKRSTSTRFSPRCSGSPCRGRHAEYVLRPKPRRTAAREPSRAASFEGPIAGLRQRVAGGAQLDDSFVTRQWRAAAAVRVALASRAGGVRRSITDAGR